MVKEKRNFTFLQNENILTLAFLSKAGKTKECEFHERPAYMTGGRKGRQGGRKGGSEEGKEERGRKESWE